MPMQNFKLQITNIKQLPNLKRLGIWYLEIGA